MTCQRPANRATKQNETAIKEFQEVTFREIVLKAKKEGGMILFGDETGIYNQENYQEEYLNNMLKKNVHSGELPHTEKQLEQKDQKFYEQNFTLVGKNFKFVSPKKFVLYRSLICRLIFVSLFVEIIEKISSTNFENLTSEIRKLSLRQKIRRDFFCKNIYRKKKCKEHIIAKQGAFHLENRNYNHKVGIISSSASSHIIGSSTLCGRTFARFLFLSGGFPKLDTPNTRTFLKFASTASKKAVSP